VGIAKEGTIFALAQAVGSGILFVAPPGGKLVYGGYIVVDDGTIAHSGPDDLIAVVAQGIEEMLEMLTIQNHLVANVQRGFKYWGRFGHAWFLSVIERAGHQPRWPFFHYATWLQVVLSDQRHRFRGKTTIDRNC
jgi:hypothetical protein